MSLTREGYCNAYETVAAHQREMDKDLAEFEEQYKEEEREKEKKWKEWLQKRRESIQASDVSKILGEHPKYGALSVYESKITGYSQDDNDWMKFGREVEGAIANLYASKLDRKVTNLGGTEIQIHPEIPWLGATLDRMSAKDGEELVGPVELKHVGDFSRPDEWAKKPPAIHLIQNQIQMACTSSTWGCVAGMFPGYQLGYHDQERNDNFLDAIYPVLEMFWKCVQNHAPPPVTGKDLAVVKRLWSQPAGTTVALSGDKWLSLAGEWKRIKADIKTNKNRVEEIEAKFRGEMKNHTYGALLDGSKMTLKTTRREEYTKTVKATEFRTLRRTKVKK